MPSTIAEKLKEDPTGDVAIQIFEDLIVDAINKTENLEWQPIADLLTWVIDFFPPIHHKDAITEALIAIRNGDCEKAETILESAGPKRRGRPRVANIPAVKALIYSHYLPEYRAKRYGRAEPNWRKLAAKFHPGKADSLRITVGYLLDQIKESGMVLPDV
jgi:hypothetical protein